MYYYHYVHDCEICLSQYRKQTRFRKARAPATLAANIIGPPPPLLTAPVNAASALVVPMNALLAEVVYTQTSEVHHIMKSRELLLCFVKPNHASKSKKQMPKSPQMFPTIADFFVYDHDSLISVKPIYATSAINRHVISICLETTYGKVSMNAGLCS